MKKILGIILNAFLLFVLSILCVGGAVGFTAYSSAVITLEQGQALTNSRGRELGVALASMAGENLNSSAGLVKLTATMKEVVRTSKSRGDSFEIQEIALLNGRGELIAHNDVASLAKAADKVFQEDRYSRVMNLLKRDPVIFESLETIQSDDPVVQFINKYLPQKLASVKYHMGFAVFQVDDTSPAGRLHMIVTVRGPKAFIPALEAMARPVLIGTAAASFALMFFAVLLLVIYGSISARGARRAAGGSAKSSAPSKKNKKAPTQQAVSDNPAPAAAPPAQSPAAVRVYQSASPSAAPRADDSGVLDAIPLDE